jgi:hypothetical protein
VPTALKQGVHDKGDIATRGILKETLTRKTNTISDIPSGYRQFISKNPDKFKDYFEQKRHELGLLKSVLRNLSSDDKRKLQAYYIQNKTIEPEKFSDDSAISSHRFMLTHQPNDRVQKNQSRRADDSILRTD